LRLLKSESVTPPDRLPRNEKFIMCNRLGAIL